LQTKPGRSNYGSEADGSSRSICSNVPVVPIVESVAGVEKSFGSEFLAEEILDDLEAAFEHSPKSLLS
jgi:hypothetical protein